MTPLKIHNGGSYALIEYLTCWKCAIFHAVTASCCLWIIIVYVKCEKKPCCVMATGNFADVEVDTSIFYYLYNNSVFLTIMNYNFNTR